MRARRVHLAAVVDEYGGTAGIGTLEGCVQTALGRVPTVGDEVRLPDAQLGVAEMDGHRVATVRFERAVDTIRR